MGLTKAKLSNVNMSVHALPDNFHSLPDWLKEAYHRDQTINRIVKDWRMANVSTEVLWKKLAIAFYEQRNCWKSTYEEAFEKSALPSRIIPES